jgi:hypothetical protein
MTRQFAGRVFSNAIVALACAALMGCGGSTAPPGGGNGVPDTSNPVPDIAVVGTDTPTVGPDTTTGPPPCQSDDDCQDPTGALGPCQAPSCDVPSGECVTVNAPEGSVCDDGSACTTGDACSVGTCRGVDVSCDDDNACTEDACNEATGACEFVNSDGDCNDGLLCTTNDRCVSGSCEGDPNPICACSNDLECTKFDDGDLCNGVLVCDDALCVPDDSAVTCAGMNAGPCETAACDPADGQCKVAPKLNGDACDDSDACTQNDVCSAGSCAGKTLSCEDNNPCTSDGCNPNTGCFHQSAAGDCDDGDLCTTGDTCVGGECLGVDNPECSCTTDADCGVYEDGNLCNGTLTCVDDSCIVDTATVIDCAEVAQGLAACQGVSCIPTTGNCIVKANLDGTPCDDFSICTTTDYCLAGQCTGLSPGCDDGNPCTSEACDPEDGCSYGPLTGVPCEDKNACTINDSCLEGLCTGDTNPSCQCLNDADCAEFEDGDLCNGTLVCEGAACVVDPETVVTCEDDSDGQCTISACVPQTGGCTAAPAPNGAACNDANECTLADHCEDGQCVGDTKSCDDGDVCTADSCSPTIGCTYAYNLTFCDDGNGCTYLDTCVLGFCVGIQDQECVCDTDAACVDFEDGDQCNGTLSCQGNKCVVDPDTVVVCETGADTTCGGSVCAPESGACVSTQATDGKPCDDADACTSGDACSSGSCLGAAPVDCSDDNPCTADICNGDTGCYNPPEDNGTSCEDGDSCTSGDTCMDGGCLPGDNTCGAGCQAQDTLGCGGSDNWGTGFFDGSDDIDSYACSTDDYPGNDYVYYFEAPYDGLFDVSLTDESGLTEVFILAQTGSGCDPGNCLDAGYSYAVADMVKGDGFYIAVDNPEDTTGTYEITVDCTADVESKCDDGVDNDADTDTDCEDSDCAEAPACNANECAAALTLACGESDSATTYGVGSTNAIDGFPECNPFNYEGSEYTYAFTATVTTMVTVTLSDETADTDILVLNSTCEPDSCLGYGLTDETFEAVAGETYFLVVAGYNGAEGGFTLTVECEDTGPPPVEVCDSGADDDGDGVTDCQDSDCFGTSALCQPSCGDMDSGWPLDCPDDGDEWNNSDFGSTNVVDGYPGCFDSGMHTGPEYVYTFESETDAPITITKIGDDGDLDLFLLLDEGLGCNPASCLDWGTGQVTFDAKAGASYYIVVDGWQGAEMDYELAFSCGG